MKRSRWYSMISQPPTKDGRYWVFPYKALSGHTFVTMASFKDGKWITSSRPQEFAYWKTIEIPDPPKEGLKNQRRYQWYLI